MNKISSYYINNANKPVLLVGLAVLLFVAHLYSQLVIDVRSFGGASLQPVIEKKIIVGDVITLQQYMEGAIRNRESNHKLAFGTLAVGASLYATGPIAVAAARTKVGRVTCAIGVIICGTVLNEGNILKLVKLNRGVVNRIEQIEGGTRLTRNAAFVSRRGTITPK